MKTEGRLVATRDWEMGDGETFKFTNLQLVSKFWRVNA